MLYVMIIEQWSMHNATPSFTMMRAILRCVLKFPKYAILPPFFSLFPVRGPTLTRSKPASISESSNKHLRNLHNLPQPFPPTQHLPNPPSPTPPLPTSTPSSSPLHPPHHPCQPSRQPNPHSLQHPGQCPSSNERHDHQHKQSDRVSFRIAEQLAGVMLDLANQALDVA